MDERGAGQDQQYSGALADGEAITEHEDADANSDDGFETKAHYYRRRHVVGVNGPGEKSRPKQERKDNNCGWYQASESLRRFHKRCAHAEGKRSP